MLLQQLLIKQQRHPLIANKQLNKLLLILLILCSPAVFSQQSATPLEPSYDSVSIEWSWKQINGNTERLSTELHSSAIAQDRKHVFKLSYSLTYPQEAIRAYIGPRLTYALALINTYTEEDDIKFTNVAHALRVDENSLAGQLFWQAYRQYQSDAFEHFQLSPCLHPTDITLPCVRPDYSTLFYQYKSQTKNLAKQLKGNKPQSIKALIQKAQTWLASIRDVQEKTLSFLSPLSVLSLNQADSDEKALLLATVVSEIAPNYELLIVYPENSIGSVSPAWLVIDAKSGARGSSIFIENKEHILLSGSGEAMGNLLLSNATLVSERLY